MKRTRSIRLKSAARPLNVLELERITGGDDTPQLEQHVDNPGQTAMKP